MILNCKEIKPSQLKSKATAIQFCLIRQQYRNCQHEKDGTEITLHDGEGNEVFVALIEELKEVKELHYKYTEDQDLEYMESLNFVDDWIPLKDSYRLRGLVLQ